MSEAVKSAITSLSKGNTNGFVDQIQSELLKRAQDNIKLQKMTVSQTLVQFSHVVVLSSHMNITCHTNTNVFTLIGFSPMWYIISKD